MSEEKVSAAPEEEVVEVEVTDDGKETKAVVVEPKPEPAPAKQASDDDELAGYSEGVKKRIEKLTFKMREAERREQAALEYAKSVKNQMDVANLRTAQIDLTLSNEAENRVKLQEQLIKDRLRIAIDRGDIDGQVQAQRDLAELAVENDRVRHNRARSEAQSQEVYRQATAPQVQPQPQQYAPRRPDPKAETWAEKNAWFGSDEPMTITAFSHHKSLVEREGFDPSSDDYYDELDKRMRRDFPHKFQQTRAPSQTVGSARSSARPESSSRIRLSPSQVAIAKKLGISVEQYARQVKLLGESNDR
jgi:hypothetical protein